MERMLATGSQPLYCGERPVQTYQMVEDVITCTPVPTGGGTAWPACLLAWEIDTILIIHIL
jgi:hypothetical protein